MCTEVERIYDRFGCSITTKPYLFDLQKSKRDSFFVCGGRYKTITINLFGRDFITIEWMQISEVDRKELGFSVSENYCLCLAGTQVVNNTNHWASLPPSSYFSHTESSPFAVWVCVCLIVYECYNANQMTWLNRRTFLSMTSKLSLYSF